VSFNVGVEIGQVAFVMLIVLLERSFRQLQIRWPRWVEACPATPWVPWAPFWTIQRGVRSEFRALLNAVLDARLAEDRARVELLMNTFGLFSGIGVKF
jgi:hypothetical protein